MRWRPSASARRAYAIRMQEQNDDYDFINSNGAIRKGCKVRWVDKPTSEEFQGEVVRNSYGQKTGQHTFSIQTECGELKRVKGRNLYDRLLQHIQGEESKNV